MRQTRRWASPYPRLSTLDSGITSVLTCKGWPRRPSSPYFPYDVRVCMWYACRRQRFQDKVEGSDGIPGSSGWQRMHGLAATRP